jgi:hypothetical protein
MMKFARFAKNGRGGLAAAAKGEEFYGLFLDFLSKLSPIR